MIRIRAFRAIDDNKACQQYAKEHMDVLKIYGITKITTANNSWMENPNVYVIMAERTEDNQPVGGARIHIYDPAYPLPMDVAVKDFDPSVKELLEQHHNNGGTGEICGLWNSRDVAGWGIGTIFLSRAGVALAKQLPMQSMFVLCAEHTIGITLEKGFVIETKLGDSGGFNYPKEGLVATAAVIDDLDDLSHAEEKDREIIMSLRANNRQTRHEVHNGRELEIEYQLDLKL